MTDFSKVKSYYTQFNEWSRLDAPSGQLEFELTKKIIMKYLNDDDKILDLGGGPGRYTIELAKLGYMMSLADKSKELLNQARAKIDKLALTNVEAINEVNAIDLSIYDDDSFDVVLLMGPLYHLTKYDERIRCLKEVHRILKQNGLIIASYIPYLSGTIGIIDRFFYAPSHVGKENLKQVFDSGVFINKDTKGFQEGYYPSTRELEELTHSIGFKKECIRSIRGFGFNREEEILKLKDNNEEMYNSIINLIDKTAEESAIIETCAHALYVGRKTE